MNSYLYDMLWWLSFSIMGIFHFQKFFTFPQVYVSSTQNSEKIIIVRLPTKVHIVKSIIFPVIVYGCESWTIKKAEHWSIDTYKLWCWRRLLRVPYPARRSNQSILKEINPEYSLEGHAEAEVPILWPPDGKSQVIGKDRDAGKDWRQEEKGMTKDNMVG